MLGQHVSSELGDSRQANSAAAAAARVYLASTEAQQLRLSDTLLLAADLKLHAQHADAGAPFVDDEALLSAAMLSPVGTISDMLAYSDPFQAQKDALSILTATDAVSFRLGELAGLQTAYRRRLEAAAFPVALPSCQC